MLLRRSRSLRRTLCAAASLVLVLVSTRALALEQPDGTTIPVIDPSVTICSDLNVQVCLDDEEGGATIDALAAAAVTPETYVAGCALTFSVVARGGDFLNTFGWYNVNPDGPPPHDDLHAFLLCDDAVGTTRVLDIASDPAYLGGPIGFFMATPEGVTGNCPEFYADGGPVPGTVGYVYYSEPAYNPDNVGPNSWIHLVTYDSVAHESSFYFAWEDLLTGGDNDFDDLLTRVEGIQCLGGGVACDTGLDGECASGITQCKNGLLECIGQRVPVDESCNALDDDCSGTVDDGELCPPDEVCFQGQCQPRCGFGEFNCPNWLSCNDEGLCVEPACLEVECGAGELCAAGECQGWCDDIVCPHGLECRAGACFDGCDGVVCEPDYLCVAGVCVLECGCGGCSDELVCELASGRCVEPGCVGVGCGPGFHCVSGGACVDSCEGASCPVGQLCALGACVPDGSGGSGGTAGGGGDGPGGFSFGGAGGEAVGGSGGWAVGGGWSDPPREDARGSCGCRVPGSGLDRRAPWALGAAVLLLGTARRARRGRA